jgi:hypothetical protein
MISIRQLVRRYWPCVFTQVRSPSQRRPGGIVCPSNRLLTRIRDGVARSRKNANTPGGETIAPSVSNPHQPPPTDRTRLLGVLSSKIRDIDDDNNDDVGRGREGKGEAGMGGRDIGWGGGLSNVDNETCLQRGAIESASPDRQTFPREGG